MTPANDNARPSASAVSSTATHSRHSALADQLAPLLAWMRRPELDAPHEPMQTNWTVTPSDMVDAEEVGEMSFERSWRMTPSVEQIMRSVKDGDIERNDAGQIIRIGKLTFSDGTQTEHAYRLSIDGAVQQFMARMPAGAMLATRDKPESQLGADENPDELRNSNAYYAEMLGTEPHRYKTGGKRRNGTNYSASQSRQVLAEAYANTDMTKVTVSKYPAGLPCGSNRVADSFLGMKKSTCAGGGKQAWDDIASALVDRDIWAETVANLNEDDASVLDSAAVATDLRDIFGALGGHKRTAERKGKRRLIAANDNLAEFMKIFAA